MVNQTLPSLMAPPRPRPILKIVNQKAWNTDIQDHTLHSIIHELPEMKALGDKHQIISTSRCRSEQEYMKVTIFPHFFEDVQLGNGVQNYAYRIHRVLNNILATHDEGTTVQNARAIYNRLMDICKAHKVDFPPVVTRSQNKKRDADDAELMPPSKRIALVELAEKHSSKRQERVTFHKKRINDTALLYEQRKAELHQIDQKLGEKMTELKVLQAQIDSLQKSHETKTSEYDQCKSVYDNAIKEFEEETSKFDRAETDVKRILEQI